MPFDSCIVTAFDTLKAQDIKGQCESISGTNDKRDNARHTHYLIQPKTDSLPFLDFLQHNTRNQKSYIHSTSHHHAKLATMCQLCALGTISKSSRWPKPLESLVSDLSLLINTVHSTLSTAPKTTAAAPDTKQKPSTKTTTKITITTTTATPKPSPLLPTLHDINTLLELLEDEKE
jgi:hypothetical protein